MRGGGGAPRQLQRRITFSFGGLAPAAIVPVHAESWYCKVLIALNIVGMTGL